RKISAAVFLGCCPHAADLFALHAVSRLHGLTDRHHAPLLAEAVSAPQHALRGNYPRNSSLDSTLLCFLCPTQCRPSAEPDGRRCARTGPQLRSLRVGKLPRGHSLGPERADGGRPRLGHEPMASPTLRGSAAIAAHGTPAGY